MSHTIIGEIRKDVYTKSGDGNKGPYKMYIVELSEKYKDRDGKAQYTNYSATLFANQNQIPYYDEWLSKGNVVAFTCKTLEVRQREHNGTTYITLAMTNPSLEFFQSKASSDGHGQQKPQSKPQSSAPQKQQGGSQGMDFDDDIPF